jgi:hypothetical protein
LAQKSFASTQNWLEILLSLSITMIEAVAPVISKMVTESVDDLDAAPGSVG